MSETEYNTRIQANIKVALQRYMLVLIQKHRHEKDGLLRDLLWNEMMELDHWFCGFVEDEDVSLYDMAERKSL